MVARRLRLPAVVGTSALLALGVMHTRLARPLWRLLGVGCPIDRVTPEQVEATRQKGLQRLRGTQRAPSRPAFGLKLDETTQDEAVAWAASKGLRCELTIKGMHYLRCGSARSAAFGMPSAQPVDDATFAFSPTGKLIAISLWRTQLSGQEAATIFRERTTSLSKGLGPPSTAAGDASPGYLDSGPLHLVTASYRFSDYIASITATSLSGHGVTVREQYQSAAETM